MSKVIGIDLGTTNSCVAVIEGGDPIVIPNSLGSRTTPSMVAFTEGGERLVGQIAKRQAVTNPENTVYSVKRLMGTKMEDAGVQRACEAMPYDIVGHDNGDAWVKMRGRNFSPPEISAMILEVLKETAEAYLGETVFDAVLTVPAYFDDSQRAATKDAGRIAGLNVLRIINEPTAAALAYGVDRDEAECVVGYDLGGGTFDVSILELQSGVFEVKATNGDTFLGGEDFDQRIVDFFAKEFEGQEGIDLRTDRMALQRLREAAEKAKHELSSTLETEINLPFITADESGPKHLNLTLSRSALEGLVEDLIERTLEPCEIALTDSGISQDKVDQVILVGGMTRMPRIQERVKSFFKKAPHTGVNPDEVVALGAAIQAGVLRGDIEEVLLLDVTPLSLGVETLGGVFTRIIEKNTPIPCREGQIFSTAEDNQPIVNIHVLQGEREMARDNKSLARFQLVDIPPAPRGVPQIEVTFAIDANGILSVAGKDLGTGQEQSVRVIPSSGLSETEIERLVSEAETNRDDDVVRREMADLKNTATSLMYTTERSLASYGDILGDEAKEAIRADVQVCRDALNVQDPEALRDALHQLETSSYKIAEAMYADAGAEAPPGDAPPMDDLSPIGDDDGEP